MERFVLDTSIFTNSATSWSGWWTKPGGLGNDLDMPWRMDPDQLDDQSQLPDSPPE